MEELGTPAPLMDERMGHTDGSVQARYSHVTDEMRKRLLRGLTEQRETALEARRSIALRSPIVTLDALLTGRSADRANRIGSPLAPRRPQERRQGPSPSLENRP
jgi:hypothetical protein